MRYSFVIVFLIICALSQAASDCRKLGEWESEFLKITKGDYPDKLKHKDILKDLGIEKVEKLGSGYRAKVYRFSADKVVKIARYEEDRYRLYVEYRVNQLLRGAFNTYGIRTDQVVKYHPDFLYLIKDTLSLKENFGSAMYKSLTSLQLERLEVLFNAAKAFANDYSIGLDIKAENLVWNQELGDWILIDSGPRTSYLPYGYTLDRKNFQEYLKYWFRSEPSLN